MRTLLEVAAIAADADFTLGEFRRLYSINPTGCRQGYGLTAEQAAALEALRSDWEAVHALWWKGPSHEQVVAYCELTEAHVALLEVLPPPDDVLEQQIAERHEAMRRRRSAQGQAPGRAGDALERWRENKAARDAEEAALPIGELVAKVEREEAEREYSNRQLTKHTKRERMAGPPPSLSYRSRVRRRQALQKKKHGGMLEYGTSARDVGLWLKRGLTSEDTTERFVCQRLARKVKFSDAGNVKSASGWWGPLNLAFALWHLAERVTAPRQPWIGAVDCHSYNQLAELLPMRNAAGGSVVDDTIGRWLRQLKKLIAPALESWQPKPEAVAHRRMPGSVHYLRSPDERRYFAYAVFRWRPVAADGRPLDKNAVAGGSTMSLPTSDPRSGYPESQLNQRFDLRAEAESRAERAATGPPDGTSGALRAPPHGAPGSRSSPEGTS